MALTDILFNDGERQKFLLELPAGTLGEPNDILFDYSRAAILEIGPTYPDPEIIAEAIWAYENRELTA